MIVYPAAVLEAPMQIGIREQRIDKPLAKGEVLLEVAYAGVCGTDVAIASGDYPVPLPLVLGHEVSARVADAPARSPAAALIGQAVACEINNSCAAYGLRQTCEACRRGLSTHCQRRTVMGIIQHPGAFARFLRAPAGNLHKLPKGFPLDAAALVEPLAAAIRTFELTPLKGGEAVVVLGCGRLGRLVALVASTLGAQVIAVGRSEEHLARVAPFAWRRVKLARTPGAEAPSATGTEESIEESIEPKSKSKEKSRARTAPIEARTEEELVTVILDLTRGLGADVVVEATGANESLRLAQKLVRPLGTIAMKSTSGVPVTSLDTTRATVDELRFQSSRCGPFDKAVRFMQKHKAPSAAWITARFPLERAAEAIAAAKTEPKVLIEVLPGAGW